MKCAHCGAETPDRAQKRYCSKRCKGAARDKRRPPRHRIDRRKRIRYTPAKPVVGIDSETVTRDGRTYLTLVACSNGHYIESHTITSRQALEFILDNAEGVQLWTFFGDYDINFWIRDFPPAMLDLLRRTSWCRWGPFKIHHIPRRIFEVWDRRTKRYACVYDAFPFVQKSFVKWLDTWELAPPDVIERIRAMKEKRAEFSKLSKKRVRAYTMDEVRYIQKGVETIRERIEDAKLRPARWLGPGAVASVALRRQRVKDHMPTQRKIPRTVARIADEAYYGGRIETACVGHVPGPLFQYDLRSAYPAAAVGLPCLRHGHWVHHKGTQFDPDSVPQTGTVLVRVDWKRASTRTSTRTGAPMLARPTWGPFPGRRAGDVSLHYYNQGRGWYWLDEVRPWLEHPAYTFRFLQAWEWQPACDHQPFEFVRDLYARRAELKARNDPSEYCIKLVLNSLYGKLAQRVGSRPYLCLEWAGLITARTRGRIGEVLVAHGDSILVVATDGIISTKPLDIEGEGLGSWEGPTRIRWADVWQPGFYIVKRSDGITKRTRGFLGVEVDHLKLRRHFNKYKFSLPCEIPRRRVVGYRLATHLGKPETIGQWNTDPARLSFEPRPRRVPVPGGRTVAPTPLNGTKQKRAIRERIVQEWRAQKKVSEYWQDGIDGGFETG